MLPKTYLFRCCCIGNDTAPPEWIGFFMLNLQEILQTKDFKPQTTITTKWQDRAYQIWKAFDLTRRDLPNLFRFFKTNYDKHPGLIEEAYSFTADYEGNIPKFKLFLWQFQALKIKNK